MKLLDTKTGDALSSLKVNFVKTPSFENLNNTVVKKSSSSQASNLNTQNILNNTSPEIIKSQPIPCDNPLGILTVTNHFRYQYAWQNNDDEHKVVMRIPKIGNAKADDDYYYLILGKDEVKSFNFLKEGFHEYEARRYCNGGFKGWCWNFETVSSGQIQITKCKTIELLIK